VRAEGEKPRSEIINADCVEYLRTLPENSVDSVVTDPPYELAFMGRKWDSTGIAFQVSTWAEVFRVLRPGGHLLAFGGTRTYHRLACAVEDAGFEIRDEIQWIYSTGFPKSHNVGKALDEDAEAEPTEFVPNPAERPGNGEGATTSTGWAKPNRPPKPLPVTPEAREWQGWGTALKPAHEPILVARKPLIGTVAENVLEHGTGALNVDATRVGWERDVRNPATNPLYRAEAGYKTECGPDSNATSWSIHPNGATIDPSPAGRWPPNLLLTHSPGCRQSGMRRIRASSFYPDYAPGESERKQEAIYGGGKGLRDGIEYKGTGMRPAGEMVESWSCAPGCPVAEMDRQSGFLEPSGQQRTGAPVENRPGIVYGGGKGFPPHTSASIPNEGGGASRFFPTFSWHTEEVSFIYCPKAPSAEREAGLEDLPTRNFGQSGGAQKALADGEDEYIQEGNIGLNRIKQVRNHHPTVKPIAMLRWLVRLVTPPGGLVLDPFAGSGSTGCAAMIEGFRFLGIEKEAEYIEIAKRRIAYWGDIPKGQAPGGLLADSRAPSVTLDSFVGEA
jgi:DNA modification methylase